MRRIVIITIAAMAVVTGCTNNNDILLENESLSAQVESLSNDNTNLSVELEKLKNEKDAIDKRLKSIEESIAAVDAERKIQKEDVTVTLVQKESVLKDANKWIFSNYCPLKFEVTNNTDKEIQGVQGNIKLMDLFGSEIMTVGCDFLGELIPANQTVTYDLQYEVNEFIAEDMKLFNTGYTDLKTEYTIKKIVFTDGSEKE